MKFIPPVTTIPAPYLVFIGDVVDPLIAKTAFGIVDWRPELCLGQMRLAGCELDLGLPDLGLPEALVAGVKSIIIGSAPAGGILPEHWAKAFEEFASAGINIVSGMHTRLDSNRSLTEAAKKGNAQLIDVRRLIADIPVGNGKKRSGKRLLTVGSDCAVGKKYTALAIEREMSKRGMNSTFRATGQTGIMIAGNGIALDAVIADFIAGAAECISPDNSPEHWDVIEGQGSLLHPAYSGVSLGLLHGSQPDAIVLCHDPKRSHIYICPEQEIPPLNDCIAQVVQLGKLTNKLIRPVGISVNLSRINASEHEAYLNKIRFETGLPCTDPVLYGVSDIVDYLIESEVEL
ncbi:MAG: DUF1611 domain-containing protein [Paraglaciecola sp.]|uniref:DUF1611 domain-containing protein n=1 Tax=Paraglaciecola sp. TaxID=1920173 RepID=UPI003296ACD2